MKYFPHRISKLLLVTALSALLASCLQPPSYNGGSWNNLIQNNTSDLCEENSADVLQRQTLSALPYYVVTSRLPDCRADKIRLTIQRSEKIRYGRFSALPETRKRAKEEVLAASSDLAFEGFDAWLHQINEQANRNDGRAILYVHGYNETYLETATRIARIEKITQFTGPIIQYSWPSHSRTLRYAVDKTNLEFNKPHFANIVQTLAKQSQIKSLILISHSLGGQLLLHGLQEIDMKDEQFKTKDSDKITNVILASADIDKQIFEHIASQYILTEKKVQNKRRITAYVSEKDKAIKFSHIINGYQRLGGTGCDDPDALPDADLLSLDRKAKARCYAFLPVTMSETRRNGLHIIDTSEVSDSDSGHSDYVMSPEACTDFVAVVHNKPLSEKRRRFVGPGNIWRLNENIISTECEKLKL